MSYARVGGREPHRIRSDARLGDTRPEPSGDVGRERLMHLPPAVERAQRQAAALGLPATFDAAEGALLHVLAARRGILRAGELGPGAGVRTAWLASALPPGTPLHVSELDAGLARSVATLFSADPHVRVHHGEWRAVLLPEAPFDLLAGVQVDDDPDAVLGLVAPGGTVVVGGVSAAAREAGDRWTAHPDLVAATVVTAPGRGAIVAVRVH